MMNFFFAATSRSHGRAGIHPYTVLVATRPGFVTDNVGLDRETALPTHLSLLSVSIGGKLRQQHTRGKQRLLLFVWILSLDECKLQQAPGSGGGCNDGSGPS